MIANLRFNEIHRMKTLIPLCALFLCCGVLIWLIGGKSYSCAEIIDEWLLNDSIEILDCKIDHDMRGDSNYLIMKVTFSSESGKRFLVPDRFVKSSYGDIKSAYSAETSWLQSKFEWWPTEESLGKNSVTSASSSGLPIPFNLREREILILAPASSELFYFYSGIR